MIPFLQRVAEAATSCGVPLHRVGIVLPTRRAERSLRRHWGQGTPVLSPSVWAIEEVMADLAGVAAASPTEQLLALFSAHRKVAGAHADPLDEFLRWAPTILRDFGELDRHGADTLAALRELREIEALGEWGLDQPTELMSRRLTLWRQLPDLYTSYHETLGADGLTTPGMQFRRASPPGTGPSEAAWSAWCARQGVDRLFFAGFNALTPPEEALLRSAHLHLGAQALWDADRHYLDLKVHEAGEALRDLLIKLPEGLTGDLSNAPAHWATSSQHIEVISASRHLGVAQTVGALLEEWGPDEARQTAVVLGDESLLVPVLQALPEGIEEANVTMGLPLNLTLPYAGVEVFLQLHEARAQNRGSYPRRLLEATLIHPFAAMMVSEPSILFSAQFELRRARRAHWSAAQVEALLGADAALWRPAPDPRKLIQELAKRTAYWLSVPRPAWEGEPARAVLQILERLQGMLPDEVLGVGSLLRLYRSLATESPVAFFGEPFNGLQIMGLLETRALDFKRLIIAPLNEGVLPQGRSTSSFLPFDLRKAYGLPLPQDRESVAAYHLYRLMQRAETVVMVVNSEPDGLGKGEPSRWVRQAQLELASYPGVTVTDRRLTWPLRPDQFQPAGADVPSGPEVWPMVAEALLRKGLSPTGFQRFLEDPYLFLVRNVLEIREESRTHDRVAADALGTALHFVHEQLYKTLRDHKTWALDRVEAWTHEGVNKEMPSSLDTGYPLLTRQIALHMAQAWAEAEGQRNEDDRELAFEIIGVEEMLEAPLQLDFGPVPLRGTADRIERWSDGRLVVVDLKTGAVDEGSARCKNEWSELQKPSKAKGLQLMTYAWMLGQRYPDAREFQVGIAPMRRPHDPVLWFSIAKRSLLTHADLDAFEAEVLRPLANSIAEFFQGNSEAR
ncbi:MAG: PD-(D/E)XK nuclease family protein [Cryomorphaceae bacterium]|nr:PD-(D/E)XK nuclease family protein [Cryomorphaceae bacterium]